MFTFALCAGCDSREQNYFSEKRLTRPLAFWDLEFDATPQSQIEGCDTEFEILAFSETKVGIPTHRV